MDRFLETINILALAVSQPRNKTQTTVFDSLSVMLYTGLSHGQSVQYAPLRRVHTASWPELND